MLKDLTNYNMDDITDPVAVDEGEYKIRIIDIMGIRQDKNNNPFTLIRYEICDIPYAKDFTEFTALPSDNMDPKKEQRTLAYLKNFCLAFGITFAQLNEALQNDDASELLGLEGWAILGQTKDDPEYGVQNRIKQFIGGA